MERETLFSSELLRVLRQSLNGTASTYSVSSDGEVGFDPTNPLFRRLAEEILLSRRFILTYYLVLGAVVAAFSSIHWTRKLVAWRRNRTSPRIKPVDGQPTPQSTSSSSSSTLHGIESPPVKDIAEQNERAPLLPRDKLQEYYNDGMVSRLRRYIEAWLMYQPRPIAALTSPNNHLPPNGTTLVILLLLAINIFYLFYRTPLSIPMLFAFSDRAGLCFVANLPVLYLLAAKTNQPLKFLTGWSYEGLNVFHRRIGEWMMIFAILHCAGMFGVWGTLLRPFHFTLLRFLSTKLVILGMLALGSYLAIYVTSIGWVRRLYYETFLGLHIVLQVAALVFLFFHHPNSRPFVIASLAIWILDRVFARTIASFKVVATLEVARADRVDTVLLFCDIPLSRSNAWFRTSICKGWKAGHHVFLTVPGIGWKHRLQTHPFTIASPAPPQAFQGTWPLQLTIRAQAGFSKDLLEYAKCHQHAEIWLDGPYGGTEVLEALEHADRTCLIAGGSGIAVTYPLTWHRQVRTTEDCIASTRTTYQRGMKIGSSIGNFEEIPNRDKCAHLWVRQDPRHGSWITMYPVWKQQSRVPAFLSGTQTVADLVSAKFDTRSPSTGRPDMRTELREWVEGMGSSVTDKRHSIVVVVSGPDTLVRDVRNASAELVKAGYNIDVYVEKFGW